MKKIIISILLFIISFSFSLLVHANPISRTLVINYYDENNELILSYSDVGPFEDTTNVRVVYDQKIIYDYYIDEIMKPSQTRFAYFPTNELYYFAGWGTSTSIGTGLAGNIDETIVFDNGLNLYPVFSQTKVTQTIPVNKSNTVYTSTSSTLTYNFEMELGQTYTLSQIKGTNDFPSIGENVLIGFSNDDNNTSTLSTLKYAPKLRFNTLYSIYGTPTIYEISGVWTSKITSNNLPTQNYNFTFNFNSNNTTWTSISFDMSLNQLKYGNTIVFNNGVWTNTNYKIIDIVEDSSDFELFTFIDTYYEQGNTLPVYVNGYFTFSSNPLIFPKDYLYAYASYFGGNELYNFIGIAGTGKINYTLYDPETINTDNPTIVFSQTVFDSSTGWIDNQYRYVLFNNTYIPRKLYDALSNLGQWGYIPTEQPEYTLTDLFFGIVDTPVKYISSLMSFELFGINVFIGFCSLITLLVAMYIIKRLI